MPHRCACHAKIPCRDAAGIALMSEAPGVRDRLAGALRESSDRAGVYIAEGPSFLEHVESLLEPLTSKERSSIRAAALDPCGGFDPWTAGPVEGVLARLRTPWLPELLNRDALRHDLQPIVESDTLEVHGMEALVRSAAPFEGRSPGEIIEAARAHDALLRFDQASRRLAITGGAPKLEGGERLFVNFLPMTVYDPDVCLRTTFDAAREANFDFSRIVFEVVESEMFPDVDHLRAILDAYRAEGATVGLDDIGSGNTSLVFIDHLEPDYIKLDRELMAQAVRDRETAMIGGIVQHARRRGIRVIAEGIETAEMLESARRLGADFVQGYYIARPSAEPVRGFAGKRAA